jgi:xanthine/uracil permease
MHPVDETLPLPRLIPLAIQHVLVMYAGAVAEPLIVGRGHLPPDQVAFLISADLFVCGMATIVQSLGFPGVGIRLPVMMGVTFASVGPMLSMAATPDSGLLGIYRSVIGAGIFGVLAAPFISRLLPLFPLVVTGTIILVIGHPGHRRVADAGGHKLGRRWPANVHPGHRRHAGGLPQSGLRPADGPGDRAVRAGGFSPRRSG